VKPYVLSNDSVFIEIREADSADAYAIETLYRSLMWEGTVGISAEKIDAFASSPDRFLLVCRHSGTLCSTVFVSLFQDFPQDQQAYGLAETIVSPEAYPRRTIDEKIIEYVKNLCGLRNCMKVMFIDLFSDALIHQFCTRQGFSVAATPAFDQYRVASPTCHTDTHSVQRELKA
jgi:hypothetical protein